ncbi:MAG: HD-GYP domain-containing protein (c-di-GMP phosphodiesterase class II) [Planctomycetota bacterium]|jgi:HD-GYP domain-containing protein (c-di-GMP phosphodiesterase class II)
MKVFFALAKGGRARRLRAGLPLPSGLESFETSAELLEHVATSKPPAGIVVAALPGGALDKQLFTELAKALPGCPRVLWLPDDDLGTAALAIERGGLERLLGEHAGDAEISEAFQALLQMGERQALEQLETQQLYFTRQVLQDTVDALEHCIEDTQRESTIVEAFIDSLRSVTSLQEMVVVAAHAVSVQLPGRGVHLVLDGTVVAGAPGAWDGEVGGDVLLRLQLKGYERLLGVLEITAGRENSGVLSSQEKMFVETFEAPLTLVTQGLIHRVERNNAQLATVHGLARLAENRDETTGRHLERVSIFSRMLGEFLRDSGVEREALTDKFIEDLEISAPLHDIGKVAVPDAILKKSGPLSADEWEIMRSHAELGARALETILASSGEQSYLRMGQAIAWCHHEHWNGNGYPRGLREDQIPLEARIMALADVYDALTTVRPYKEAWSHERTCDYVAGLAAEQFDPELVRVFLAHSDAFAAKRIELEDDFSARIAA